MHRSIKDVASSFYTEIFAKVLSPTGMHRPPIRTNKAQRLHG